MSITVEDAAKLLAEAKAAREHAYAPYSHFRVGAALLFEGGAIVRGCNVENASYGLCICAERNAMTTAVTQGLTHPAAIAITGNGSKLCPPCGACRQFLAEFNLDMAVVLEDDGKPAIYTLRELLPLTFALDDKQQPKES